MVYVRRGDGHYGRLHERGLAADGDLGRSSLVDAHEVSIRHLNLVFIGAAVADDGDLAAVLDALLCCQSLEFTLGAALLGEQAVDVDGARSVLEVEVAVLVVVLEVLHFTLQLVPNLGALGSCVELGDGGILHFVGLGLGGVALTVDAHEVSIHDFNLVAVRAAVTTDGNLRAVLDALLGS